MGRRCACTKIKVSSCLSGKSAVSSLLFLSSFPPVGAALESPPRGRRGKQRETFTKVSIKLRKDEHFYIFVEIPVIIVLPEKSCYHCTGPAVWATTVTTTASSSSAIYLTLRSSDFPKDMRRMKEGAKIM